MSTLETTGTIIGFMLAGIALALWRYYRATGRIPFISSHKSANKAHNAMPEVQETLDRMESKIDCVDDKVTQIDVKVDETQDTVAYLHRDELGNDALARRRLDIDRDDDLLSD